MQFFLKRLFYVMFQLSVKQITLEKSFNRAQKWSQVKHRSLNLYCYKFRDENKAI